MAGTGTIHSARVSGPMAFTELSGGRKTIPIGPCLLQALGIDEVEIFWGADGERSAVLSRKEMKSAADLGDLVLLD